MIKSELIERISSQNPHLFQRDVEKVVNAIFDQIVEAMRRGDRVELRGFGASQDPRSTSGAQPAYRLAVAVAKKAMPFFKTGKEMRARLNWETVPSD
jgi:integration host factor subunit beta